MDNLPLGREKVTFECFGHADETTMVKTSRSRTWLLTGGCFLPTEKVLLHCGILDPTLTARQHFLSESQEPASGQAWRWLLLDPAVLFDDTFLCRSGGPGLVLWPMAWSTNCCHFPASIRPWVQFLAPTQKQNLQTSDQTNAQKRTRSLDT